MDSENYKVRSELIHLKREAERMGWINLASNNNELKFKFKRKNGMFGQYFHIAVGV